MSPTSFVSKPLRAAFAALAALAACSTPSSEIDAGDLLGVFQHDAGAHDAGADARAAAADGGAGKRDGGAATARAVPAPSASAHAPPEGSCVSAEGDRARAASKPLGRPPCRDAQVLEWQDPEGSPRYGCVIAPKGAETRAPLPLVVFFHAPGDTPTAVDRTTGLRKLAATLNLTGDPAHAGFVLLAPQGRSLAGGEGASFDAEFTGADNADVAAVDHFVDELAAKRLIDAHRIYAIGASVAGKFAATYAMLRADRVAAFAVYGSDSPRASWSCPGPQPPAFVVYRACDDIVACDAVERWLRARDATGAETRAVRLGLGDEEEPNCSVRNQCTKKRALGRHRRWPKEREPEMLRFLAAHTLVRQAPGDAP